MNIINKKPKDYAVKILNERISKLNPCDFCEHQCLLGVCKKQIDMAKYICIEQLKFKITDCKESFCGAHTHKLEIDFYDNVIKELEKI